MIEQLDFFNKLGYEEPHFEYGEDVFSDMRFMHKKFKVHEAVDKLDTDKLRAFLKFRLDFLREELNEGYKAFEDQNAEEIVDALIDIVVIAVGTCDLLNIDFTKAWTEVLIANCSKEVGVKESRPNPLGLPDLIKPEGWLPPCHKGNHGKLTKLFS